MTFLVINSILLKSYPYLKKKIWNDFQIKIKPFKVDNYDIPYNSYMIDEEEKKRFIEQVLEKEEYKQNIKISEIFLNDGEALYKEGMNILRATGR